MNYPNTDYLFFGNGDEILSHVLCKHCCSVVETGLFNIIEHEESCEFRKTYYDKIVKKNTAQFLRDLY
jgi:hypothetical protein